MKKLLISTALASLAFTGTASAQSLLERVLESTNTQAITGIFSNTADNILAGATPDVVNIGGTATTEDRTLQAGDIILVNDSAAGEVAATVSSDGSLFVDADGDGVVDSGEAIDVRATLGSTVLTDNGGNLTVATSNLTAISTNTLSDVTNIADFNVATVTTTVGGDTYSTSGINASITNILRGLDGPTATTETTQATEAVTALIGNISTTALGAVNTGDIELLGSNQTLTDNIDRATAGTSEAIQQRIDQNITQVGTTASQTVLAINSALNETNVNASVLNTMSGVNATIGRSGFENSLTDANFTAVATMQADAVAALTGGISTTALGAVNTGTIVSGANDQVGGVVEAIVGNAAVSTN
jgi:hypothetical protein